MKRVAQFRWVLKSAVALALVLLACRLATAFLGANLPATMTRDGSVLVVDHYLRRPTPDIALVGSSLAWRLKEEYFSMPRVGNLGLIGDSPLTGLAIIAGQRVLPKIILVETNLLSRPAATSLVEKCLRHGETAVEFLRPVRTAVAAYESWIHGPPGAADAPAERKRLLSEPPSDFDSQVYVDRAVEQMNGIDPSQDVTRNLVQLEELVAAVERRGARVVLIEVPVSPRVGATRSAATTRQMVHAAFPDPAQWLRIDPPLAELRWADGVHLDERSALVVVQSIEKALAPLAPDGGSLEAVATGSPRPRDDAIHQTVGAGRQAPGPLQIWPARSK